MWCDQGTRGLYHTGIPDPTVSNRWVGSHNDGVLNILPYLLGRRSDEARTKYRDKLPMAELAKGGLQGSDLASQLVAPVALNYRS